MMVYSHGIKSWLGIPAFSRRPFPRNQAQLTVAGNRNLIDKEGLGSAVNQGSLVEDTYQVPSYRQHQQDYF